MRITSHNKKITQHDSFGIQSVYEWNEIMARTMTIHDKRTSDMPFHLIYQSMWVFN